MTDSRPRFKKPKQARSKATVEALLEATADVLVEHGYAKASTNRIAKRAGVSVGSLYQFFRNKDALVRALAERHISEQSTVLAESLRDLAGLPLGDAVRRIVAQVVAMRRADRELSRILYVQLPQIDDFDLLRQWRRQTALAVEFALGVRADLRELDLALASFLVVSAIDGVVSMALLAREDMLEHADFVDEVAEMVVRYLRP